MDKPNPNPNSLSILWSPISAHCNGDTMSFCYPDNSLEAPDSFQTLLGFSRPEIFCQDYVGIILISHFAFLSLLYLPLHRVIASNTFLTTVARSVPILNSRRIASALAWLTSDHAIYRPKSSGVQVCPFPFQSMEQLVDGEEGTSTIISPII